MTLSRSNRNQSRSIFKYYHFYKKRCDADNIQSHVHPGVIIESYDMQNKKDLAGRIGLHHNRLKRITV